MKRDTHKADEAAPVSFFNRRTRGRVRAVRVQACEGARKAWALHGIERCAEAEEDMSDAEEVDGAAGPVQRCDRRIQKLSGSVDILPFSPSPLPSPLGRGGKIPLPFGESVANHHVAGI